MSSSPAAGASPPSAPPARRSRQGAARRAEGDRTRELLMDTAEALFAEHGVEGPSIRSVNSAAGVSPASVHYHFGDKDGLVRAVIGRRGALLVQAQAALLDDVESSADRPQAADAVRSLAEPVFGVLRDDPVGGARWLTILARLVAAGDERVYVGVGPDSVGERINALAAAAFPDVDPEVVAHRWRLASTALLSLLAGESATLCQPDEAAARVELGHVVTFVAAGLVGAVSGG